MNSRQLGPAEGSAKGDKSSEKRPVETAPPAPVIRSADSSGASAPGDRSSGRPTLSDDDPIQVSLGAPEPLPGLARAMETPENLASNAGRVRWRSESSKAELDAFPGLSSPADRDEFSEPPPGQLAEQPRTGSEPDATALLAQAERNLRALKTYQVKISRQERVQGHLQPEEEILLSIRSDPRAVRLEWSNGPSKGREVIYSSKLDPRMIFVHQPATALVVPSMKIPVDSPLVTRNSRHSITEAGFDTILANLHRSKGSTETDHTRRGELVYEEIESAPGLDQPCHHFVRRSAAGELWNIYLDPQSLLPRLVVALDSAGNLIERYAYQEIRENPSELALAAAFDPDERWGASQGLISRLARAAATSNLPAATNSATR